MKIKINGEICESEARNLAELLQHQGFDQAVVATALNGNFIAQSQRAQTELTEGDSLEVLAPMQGG